MSDIPFLNEAFIKEHNDYKKLVAVLKSGFASEGLITPPRHHHEYSQKDMLILMPAWQTAQDLGVKIISTNPRNAALNMPTINGLYIYMDFNTGVPKAILDAKALTTMRTAATSAMAASLLANKDRRSMLMIGTGALAPALIRAHCAVSNIKKVYVWGRDFAKAEMVTHSLDEEQNDFQIESIQQISDVIQTVDLISTATYSQTPLVPGSSIKQGCHIDLVGSYKVDMREADDEVIRRSKVFVDSYAGAMGTTGDLTIPLERGVLKEEDVKADLFELCRSEKVGRTSPNEITLFKSVGHGLEDLVAARYFCELYTK